MTTGLIALMLGLLVAGQGRTSSDSTTSTAAPDGFRTISYTEAVCAKVPSIAANFEVPEDFTARAAGTGIEAGCLLGVSDDLDYVMAEATRGDFAKLRRGVFYTRVSTSVINSPETGVFDALDGTGEVGVRRQLEGAGAKVVIWKKERLAGLPALQIVADVGRDRVYMLYIGNTRYNSNAILVNYYHPTTRSARDDRLWARFVAGIKKAQ